MPAIQPDTWAQVYATVIIGIIAVVGSIVGAIWGAKVGAKATENATTAAIAAERETAHEQRLHEAQILSEQRIHEDRMLIRALVTECRLNAVFMRAERPYQPDPRFRLPLRHVALDRATAVLADLDSGDRELVETTVADWLWFNQLVGIAELYTDSGGMTTVAPALITEIKKVGLSLPVSFDVMADMLADRFGTEAGRAEALPAGDRSIAGELGQTHPEAVQRGHHREPRQQDRHDHADERLHS